MSIVVIGEALRRSVALPAAGLMLVSFVFCWFASRSPSLQKFAVHFWYSGEGVFGILLQTALGKVIPALMLGIALDQTKVGHSIFQTLFGWSQLGRTMEVPDWLRNHCWAWSVTLLVAFGAVPSSDFLGSFKYLASIALVFVGGRFLQHFAHSLRGRPSYDDDTSFGIGIELCIWLFATAMAFFWFEDFKHPIILGIVMASVCAYRVWRGLKNTEGKQSPLKGTLTSLSQAISCYLIALLVGAVLETLIASMHLFPNLDTFRLMIGPYGFLSSGFVVVVCAPILGFVGAFLGSRSRHVLLFASSIMVWIWGMEIERSSPGSSMLFAALLCVTAVVAASILEAVLRRKKEPKSPAMLGILRLEEWVVDCAIYSVPIILGMASFGVLMGAITLSGKGGKLLSLIFL
ncbi:hypothetical protein [Hwanghaeella sp.]|uniref:hypothetical protein n=1 Tax=Hwanghaeella sp. TaxID=2605943 RepID=UPI003CCC2116